VCLVLGRAAPRFRGAPPGQHVALVELTLITSVRSLLPHQLRWCLWRGAANSVFSCSLAPSRVLRPVQPCVVVIVRSGLLAPSEARRRFRQGRYSAVASNACWLGPKGRARWTWLFGWAHTSRTWCRRPGPQDLRRPRRMVFVRSNVRAERTTEAGRHGPATDNTLPGCCRPMAACLGGSDLERGVRRRSGRLCLHSASSKRSR
jgi:hypothetical protein